MNDIDQISKTNASIDRMVSRLLGHAGNVVSGLAYPEAHAVANLLWAWSADRLLIAEHYDGRHARPKSHCTFCKEPT
jgi:hypothetical protein